MKKFVLCGLFPLVLAACESGSQGYQDSAGPEKAACAGGNYQVCADIGHQARDAEGGPAKVEYPPFSQPIID